MSAAVVSNAAVSSDADRIDDAGLLVFSSTASGVTAAGGATGLSSCTEDWTEDSGGRA